MLDKFLNFLDRIILKFHKCKNYSVISSVTVETFGNLKWLSKIENKCSICEKEI